MIGTDLENFNAYIMDDITEIVVDPLAALNTAIEDNHNIDDLFVIPGASERMTKVLKAALVIPVQDLAIGNLCPVVHSSGETLGPLRRHHLMGPVEVCNITSWQSCHAKFIQYQ